MAVIRLICLFLFDQGFLGEGGSAGRRGSTLNVFTLGVCPDSRWDPVPGTQRALELCVALSTDMY